ncbi:unnamed protein product [Lymnaea stagnalis]|uniref:Uncharacterized protein n=1 Tax=Lymnaea stagnalis TaxID=6523 RepID=A0AAV2I2X1_LYMST
MSAMKIALFLMVCLGAWGTLVTSAYQSSHQPSAELMRLLNLAGNLPAGRTRNRPHYGKRVPYLRPYQPDALDKLNTYESKTIFTDLVPAEVVPLRRADWYRNFRGASPWRGAYTGLFSDEPEKGKRFFDTLGGYEVHGFKKRSVGDSDFSRLVDSQALESLLQADEAGFRHAVNTRSDVPEWDWEGAIPGGETKEDKRALDSLGGFQVHGWKRALDSLGGFNVHGWKRALDSLGGFNVHGWKRALDSLGGFNVQGWKRGRRHESYEDEPQNNYEEFDQLGFARRAKRALDSTENSDKQNKTEKRALDSLGGFNVHGWKRDDDKRALDSLGGFNVHGWKRDDDKRALDSLGGFNVHGWKRDDDKRALDSLGGFNVHGWKRDDDKRALDSLGGFNVHGWKRDDDKRALDSLGGFNVHGWKRDDDKRALDSLGGFNVHGWKRDDDKRGVRFFGWFQCTWLETGRRQKGVRFTWGF